ncbi:hypothetical protein AP75_08945 [Kaistella haifensis DSM 19056]|uniref:DUF2059 domain-containing protein n=1 Tax=Kaistella haifensis DSM 19056 TaxID=1450526 RepID=A0A246B8S2_9FLAO|nr:DUF2059 domain-containing protein [Kaistella haifensis]OWK97845.1 hypothetical protein AP75_08945 [Kaistella haifensis DSM 19056]
MKKNILAIAFLVFGVFTNAQSSKDVKIAELLETMGSTQAMKTSFEYMINYYKQNNPQISSEYWDNSLKHVDYNELVQKLVPVYSKHFTEQEIVDLLNFYNTSTGKKMIEKMPTVLQESMEVGRKWGIELAQKIEKEVSVSTKVEYSSPPPMNTK